MRICYIDHYAGSPTLGMEYRPHAMAKRWIAAGHDVTLLAGSFSHLRQENPQVSTEASIIDGVPFRFLKTRSYRGNGIGRIGSWLDFVAKGIARSREIAASLRPDVVIASSTYPFDTWLAQSIAKKSGAKLVHEVHDLWPMTPIELGGHSPKHPLMALMAAAERSAYRRSNVIVSILPNIEGHVRSLGISTPVVHVPNGVEIGPEEPAPASILALIDEVHTAGRKVIGYAGGLALSNAMDDFVAAMGRLTEEPITAIVIGDGVLRLDLETQAKHERCDVRFVGHIPKPSIGATLARMDALYIGSKRSPLYHYGVSANKIFDYLLAGVPIVNAFATSHSPLTYADCAIEAEAENRASIAAAIAKATSLDPADANHRRQRGIDYVKKHHDMDQLARDFLAAIS